MEDLYKLAGERLESLKKFLLETIFILAVFSAIFFSIQTILIVTLNTNNPVYVVTSNSMIHRGDYWKDYYNERGIDVSGFPIQGGMERGDIVMVQGIRKEDIVIGDVIVFMVPGHPETVHRVAEITTVDGELRFRTKGDANPDSGWYESQIPPECIRGKVICVIPKIGHIFLWLSGK